MKKYYNQTVTLLNAQRRVFYGKILASGQKLIRYASKCIPMLQFDGLTSGYTQDWKDRFRLPAVV